MTKDLTGINKPIEIQETHESYLIVAALGDISAGTHASAEFFNQGLPEGHIARVSRQTVWHWANGSKRVSDARLRFWKHFFLKADQRHVLAVSIAEHRELEVADIPTAHVIGKPFTASKKPGKQAAQP